MAYMRTAHRIISAVVSTINTELQTKWFMKVSCMRRGPSSLSREMNERARADCCLLLLLCVLAWCFQCGDPANVVSYLNNIFSRVTTSRSTELKL